MPPITDDLGNWSALVGILLPAVVALLQREKFGGVTNSIIFGAACVIAAAIYGWIKYGSNFTWNHWEATLLSIILWGVATFHTYWKPSGTIAAIRSKLPVPEKS